ncbi:hypothetical protein Q1695_008154 [Nippostrongylus brasiliensis]|nr:hypothetical protein Q1695_008154 [Nippostrongylus brasiliensis]
MSSTGVRVTWLAEGWKYPYQPEYDICGEVLENLRSPIASICIRTPCAFPYKDPTFSPSVDDGGLRFTTINGPPVKRMRTHKEEFILNFTRPVKYKVKISPWLDIQYTANVIHTIPKETTIVAEEQPPPPPKDLKVVQGQWVNEIIVTFTPVPEEDLYGVDKGCEVRACDSISVDEKCVKKRGDPGEKKFHLQVPKYNVLYYVRAACATGAGMGLFSHFATIQLEVPLHEVIVDLDAHRGMNIILKWIIVWKNGSDIADSQIEDVVLYQRRRVSGFKDIQGMEQLNNER